MNVVQHIRPRACRRWAERALCGLLGILVAGLALAGCASGGSTWQLIGASHIGIVLSLATDPFDTNTLYVGTSEGGILRTVTNKEAGLVASSGIPKNVTANALVADPQQRGTLYAGTSNGFYVSTDGGTTWDARGTGLPPEDGFATLAMFNGTALAGGSTEHGVYISHDQGQTWQAMNSGLPAQSNVYTLFWDAPLHTLYAAITGDGIYASTNGGASWVARNQGLPAHAEMYAITAVQTSGGQRVFLAGGMPGLYVSTDQGATWQKGGTGLPAGRVLSLAADPAHPGWIYAGTDSAVYRSENAGQSWSLVSQPLNHQVAVVLPVGSSATSPLVFAGAGGLVRYPPAPGSQGSPFGTAVTWLFILILLGGIVYFLMRPRMRMRQQLNRNGPGGMEEDQHDSRSGTSTGGKWDMPSPPPYGR